MFLSSLFSLCFPGLHLVNIGLLYLFLFFYLFFHVFFLVSSERHSLFYHHFEHFIPIMLLISNNYLFFPRTSFFVKTWVISLHSQVIFISHRIYFSSLCAFRFLFQVATFANILAAMLKDNLHNWMSLSGENYDMMLWRGAARLKFILSLRPRD